MPSVLITGASSGIGAATARLLAERGFDVFGTSRRPEALDSTAPPVRWVAMDVCDEDSVRKGVTEVLAATPRLDGLVCNAGMGIFGSVEETPVESAVAQFETNFFGVLRTLRAALPSMREAGSGRIVIVGSLSGRAPIPFQAHYSATKAAVDALSLALRNELHPLGVSVSLVEPGDIRTEFNSHTDWGEIDRGETDRGEAEGGPTARSPYGERLRNCEQVIRESLPKAPGPEVVAAVIHRALTDRRPRVRYPVGPDSWLVPIARRLLPDWLSLRVIRSHFRV